MDKNYLVISNRPADNCTYIEGPEALKYYLSQHEEITTLLFVFWSHLVPKEMLEKYRCIGFHTGPLLLGKGRGGSPIENLKRLGVRWTTLCAFDMTEKLDGGKVQLALPINLTYSKAEIVRFIDSMVPFMVAYLTDPQPEIPEVFQRLK